MEEAAITSLRAVSDNTTYELQEALSVYLKVVENFKKLAETNVSEAIDTLRKCLQKNPKYSEEIGNIVTALEKNKSDFRSTVEDVYGKCKTVSDILSDYFAYMAQDDGNSAEQLKGILYDEAVQALADSVKESNTRLRAIRDSNAPLSGRLATLQGKIGDDANSSGHSKEMMIGGAIGGAIGILVSVCTGIGLVYAVSWTAAGMIIGVVGAGVGAKELHKGWKEKEEKEHIETHDFINQKIKEFIDKIGIYNFLGQNAESKVEYTRWSVKNSLPPEVIRLGARQLMIFCNGYIAFFEKDVMGIKT